MSIEIHDITPQIEITDQTEAITKVTLFDRIFPVTDEIREILINDTFFITVIDGGVY